MSKNEIKLEEIEQTREELASLYDKLLKGELKKTHLIKEKRKELARKLTIINQANKEKVRG